MDDATDPLRYTLALQVCKSRNALKLGCWEVEGKRCCYLVHVVHSHAC